jgi:alkylation response protein AidB-like acyl-CoA dehydrogenase
MQAPSHPPARTLAGMDFDLTPEQREVQATVRQFVDERVLPNAIENDINHHLDMGVIEGMAELGLLGIVIPEAYGGAGMDFVCEALSCEEIERGEAAFRTLISVHVGPKSLQPALRERGYEAATLQAMAEDRPFRPDRAAAGPTSPRC